MNSNSRKDGTSGATSRRTLQENLETLRECKDTWLQAKKILEGSTIIKNPPIGKENFRPPNAIPQASFKDKLAELKNNVEKHKRDWEEKKVKISELLGMSSGLSDNKL